MEKSIYELSEEQKIKQLNKFICDINCLDSLYDYTQEANIFTILKSDFFEIRHSNMLAWLLNPNENHGFGDKFLKKVLFEASDSLVNKLCPYNIELMDFSDSIIYREKYHIDILIVSETNKLVVAIENKVKSGEHDNQLNRYAEILKVRYPNFNTILIYLTPDGIDASNDQWVNMGYDFIQEQLDSLLKNYRIPDKNKIYINDYVTTIRRNIVGDEELKKICMQIYNKHKAALDLIYENKPNIKSEMFEKMKSYLNDLQQEYDFTLWFETSTRWIRFIPNRLIDLCKNKGYDSWTKDEYILDFEVDVPENGAWIMKIMLGPTQDEYSYLKQRFMDIALSNTDVFNVKNNIKMSKWVRIDTFTIIKSKEELFNNENYENCFQNLIAKKIKNYLEKMSQKVDLLLTAANADK